ncbi:MAG: MOSC domain-containing protein [Candidatus Dormibacteria bacterium]
MTYDLPLTGEIESIFRYPIKSMQGEAVRSAELRERGVVGDRAYALVDNQTGNIVSSHHPRKWGKLLEWRAWWEGEPCKGVVVASLPGGEAAEVGPRLEDLLSSHLDRSVSIVHGAPPGGAYEIVHPDVEGAAPESWVASNLAAAGLGGRVGRLRLALDAQPGSLVDVAPVHLVADASLRELEAAGANADVRRFRPNIVLRVKARGYQEAGWRSARIHIGDCLLEVTMATPRCIMTTLAQGELPADVEPLRRLTQANRVDIGGNLWACLGSYAKVERPGSINIGQQVSVVARRPRT